ncbi:hypothetical protein R5R35_006230 [Gryllus longicercus]|uniref:Uncharacterized protein n=1 Tax=Gryllus longicercus TaxID=2509291 RepID=A0AAN9ZJG9_9ORTH
MTAELPVIFKMEFKSGDTYKPAGCGTDSMQGMLEKFPNVVMCMNCYLNPKLELPMAVVEDGLAMADFELFPRLFPPRFPKGKYYVFINQTCEGLDKKYCGTIRVDFELKPNAD